MKKNKPDPTAKRIWVWAGIDKITKKIVGWTIGNRSAKTFQPLYDTLVSNGYEEFYSDYLPVYKKVITKTHGLGKKFTTNIESFWSDLRLFIKGLNRRTKACLKSLETLHYLIKLYIHNYYYPGKFKTEKSPSDIPNSKFLNLISKILPTHGSQIAPSNAIER